MARLVKFTQHKPLKLETNEGVKFICQCGLRVFEKSLRIKK